MASCLTVIMPRRKIITLGRITVVMAGCLTLLISIGTESTQL